MLPPKGGGGLFLALPSPRVHHPPSLPPSSSSVRTCPFQSIDRARIAAKPITMNLPKAPSLIITALALLTFHASAVEYVTLRPETGAVNLNPLDVVEIVSEQVSYNAGNGAYTYRVNLDMTFEGGHTSNISTGRGSVYTSLVQIASTNGAVTIKITRANEVNAVQPTSVLVIPENATGNYDIVVETSDDTATWTPFHSQTILATDPKRFFRTRIVRRD